jgi:3-oxoacyl-[acyl-carrier protein] reductase
MQKLTKLSRSISGKVAVVTGAASGIGRATAQLFADEGARVAVIDLNETGLKQVETEINDAGGQARGWVLDVSNAGEIARVIEEIAGHFGGVDILVNNAGLCVPTAVDGDNYEEIWAKTLDVLLTAHVRLLRAALPHLRRSESPRIVNVASTEAQGATALNSPYVSAKSGVIGLTRALALDLGPEGITVNCICPGPIRTGLTAPIPEEHKNKYARRRTALLRYGEPEEVAHIILSLVLPAASFITGSVVTVDGGLLARNA